MPKLGTSFVQMPTPGFAKVGSIIDIDSEAAQAMIFATSELNNVIRESLERCMAEQEMAIKRFAHKVVGPKCESVETPSQMKNASAGSPFFTPAQNSPPLANGDQQMVEDIEPSAVGDVNGTAPSPLDLSAPLVKGTVNEIIDTFHELEQEHQQKLLNEERAKHTNALDRCAESIRFDVIVGAVIVLNVVVMLCQLQYEGYMLRDVVYAGRTGGVIIPIQRSQSFEDFLVISEHVFTAFFVFELIFRLAALGVGYLKNFTNLFDCAIVVICSLDAWVFTPMASDVMTNTDVMRVLRLVRLSKVFRVLRLMKAFEALRVLMAAIINSIGALLWSMSLLFVFELVGALLFARMVQPIIRDPEVDGDVKAFLWETFGTCFQAYISMFELTMWPGAIAKYRRLYEEIGASYSMFFVGYSILVTFAVVRVITAMFLKATLAAAQSDELKMKQMKIEERSLYVELLKKAIITNGRAGYMLTEEEFSGLNELPRMSLWLLEAGLGKDQQHLLFESLEQDGMISYAEFLHSMERMTGPNHLTTDVVIQLLQCRKTRIDVEGLVKRTRGSEYQAFGGGKHMLLSEYL